RIGSDVDTFQATNCNIYKCGGITLDNVETGASFAPRYIRFNDVIVESGKSADQEDDTCFHLAAGRDVALNNCTGLTGYYGILINGATVVQVNGGIMYLQQRHGVFFNSG